MYTKRFSLTALAALLIMAMVAFTGCGGWDCEDFCEKMQDCPGEEKESCSKSCNNIESINEKGACET